MSDDQRAAEQQRRRMGLPQGLDPRKAMDPAAMERLVRAQAAARAQAQAATQVLVGTLVTLVTSAFGFVAAFAWADAIQQILEENISNGFLKGQRLPAGTVKLIYAFVVTLLAIVVTFLVNRIAGRMAKRSALDASALDTYPR
jgi:hypothetical protein